MATAVRSRNDIEQDVTETLGLVPSFFARIPDDALEHEWELFKRWELTETEIPNKYKELLMIAVHAETRCRYCLLFHTEVAKLYGATEEEIQEAVHLAKHTVGWSAYLNGMRVDYDRFEQELHQIGEHLSAQS